MKSNRAIGSLCMLGWLLFPIRGDARESESEEVEAASPEEISGTMVITGTRTEMPLGDSPIATEVILREDIEQSGAEDLAGLLEEHPGIDVRYSYLGAAIRIQGLDPEHVLILVNGERVLGAKGGVIDLSRYALDNVERVEIVKGPSSALYGSDAMGGVINIITRQASEPYSAQLRMRGGSRSARDVNGSLGMARSGFSARFDGGIHRRDGYDLDPSDVATTGSDLEQFDVSNQVRLRLSAGFTLAADTRYMRRTLEGIDASATGAIFDRTNVIEDFQAAFKSRWVPAEQSLVGVDGSFSIYRDQYLSDQRDSDALDRYEDTRENLAQMVIQYDRILGAGHHLTLGLDALAQQMVSDRLAEGEGQRQRLALYVQDIWELIDGIPELTLVPGARLDLDTTFGINPTPKLSLRYDPYEHVAIRTSYGWGYRAPAFKELLLLFENPSAGYVVEGNPELVPESSRSLQMGAEFDATDGFWFSVNGFHNRIEDLIAIGTLEEGVPGEPIRYGYVNIASAMTRGFEVASRIEFLRVLSLHLGYTLTDTLDIERDRPLEGRALHRSTAKLSARHPVWGLYGLVRAGYVGTRPFYVDIDDDDIEESVFSDPYLTLDARFGQPLGGAVEFFVGADNLLNEGDARYLQIPPRFFYFGLTGQFMAPGNDSEPPHS